MSAGNDSVGEMWQETKVFAHDDKIVDIMRWVGTTKKRVTLTIPDNYEQAVISMALNETAA